MPLCKGTGTVNSWWRCAADVTNTRHNWHTLSNLYKHQRQFRTSGALVRIRGGTKWKKPQEIKENSHVLLKLMTKKRSSALFRGRPETGALRNLYGNSLLTNTEKLFKKSKSDANMLVPPYRSHTTIHAHTILYKNRHTISHNTACNIQYSIVCVQRFCPFIGEMLWIWNS